MPSPDRRASLRFVVLTPYDIALVATATFVTVVGLAWGNRARWPFVWRETEVMIGTTLLIACPVVVTLCCHLASSRVRSGIDQLAQGPRSFAVRPRRRMAWEVATVASVSLIAATGALGVVTASAASSGRPHVLALLPVVAWICVAAVGGIRAGSRWTSRWLPIVMGVSSYALLAVVVFTAGAPPLAAAHPLDSRSMTLYETAWWMHLVQALVPIGVILWMRRGSRWFGAATVSLALTTCILAAPAERRPDPDAARLACGAQDSLTVCTPAVKEYLAPVIAQTYSDVMVVAPVRTTRGDVLVDDEDETLRNRSAATIPRPAPGARRILLSDVGLDLSAYSRPDQRILTGQWVKALLTPPGGSPDRRVQWVLERQALRDLGLATDGSLYPGAVPYDSQAPDKATEEVAERWAHRTPSERRQWFVDHGEQWRRGSITLKDLE